MNRFFVLLVLLVIAIPTFAVALSRSGGVDPCDFQGDCVSSSIVYFRSNPDHTLYLGDAFSVPVSITAGSNTSSYSVSWSYDQSIFEKSGDTFTVVGNETGVFTISAAVAFSEAGNATESNSTLTTSQSVTVIPLEMTLKTRVVNMTDPDGNVFRNSDGTFYRNDSFCESWSATFQFAGQRTDIKINVTSVAPSLRVLNYSADPLGRTGRFCYVVETDAPYEPYNTTLVARALNSEGVSLGRKSSSQPFAVVHYDPQFTAYAYMEYGNSTAPTSLERP
ncbi:MAG: hypothetical protein JRM85_01770 [Nitrososphaerota archaeon]|nr:hypothetical protein [Nitrososphaerota archaeon]MDG6916308.1 hypothetical protein [Nitrososphaerota archaeon]MDG6946163.1 hypothetical protein [Nitrososphaerota archaeon]